MRKINKSENLIATQYHTRLEQKLMAADYNQDKDYYLDVLFNLLYCQKGLCAYSELRIIDDELIEEIKDNFVDGRNTSQKPTISVNIDHFDSTLKHTNGWLWSNLFAIDPRINMEFKRVNEKIAREKYDFINYNFMKPDDDNYNPYDLLDYDIVEHSFFPKFNLADDIKEKINIALDFLGINLSFVVRERREYVEKTFLLNQTPMQYLTAFDFYKTLNEQ